MVTLFNVIAAYPPPSLRPRYAFPGGAEGNELTDKKVRKDDINKLYEVLVSVGSVKECRDLLDDLCTVKEVEQMAQRIKAAQLLIEGKTYAQVMEETDISSATLSRVSRCVQYGSGYSRFLKPGK